MSVTNSSTTGLTIPSGHTGRIWETIHRIIDSTLHILSTLVVGLSVLIVMYGIAMQYTVLRIPSVASYILLLTALVLLGYLEGLHYGIVAVQMYDMTTYTDR